MAIAIWVNEFFEKAKDGIERSIPYSSRRSALKAREKQQDRQFVGDPIEILFDTESPDGARCGDCPYPEKKCLMCYE